MTFAFERRAQGKKTLGLSLFAILLMPSRLGHFPLNPPIPFHIIPFIFAENLPKKIREYPKRSAMRRSPPFLKNPSGSWGH
jgi:hypothetical protein